MQGRSGGRKRGFIEYIPHICATHCPSTATRLGVTLMQAGSRSAGRSNELMRFVVRELARGLRTVWRRGTTASCDAG